MHAGVQRDDRADQPADESQREPEIQPEPALDGGKERQHENSVPAHAHNGIGDEAAEIHVRRHRDAEEDGQEDRDEEARDSEFAKSAGESHAARADSPAIASPNAASGASGGRIASTLPR